jgi:hypothetical protein
MRAASDSRLKAENDDEEKAENEMGALIQLRPAARLRF